MLIYKTYQVYQTFYILINMEKDKHIQQKANAEIKAMNWYIKKDTEVSYQKEDYEYSPYDGVLTSGNTKYLAEIKVRKEYSHQSIQSFGGSFLEFDKLKYIIKQKEEKNIGDKIAYIIFLKDRMNVYEIDNNPNNYKWELRYLPNNDFDKTKVWKMVTMLNTNTIIKVINYK